MSFNTKLIAQRKQGTYTADTWSLCTSTARCILRMSNVYRLWSSFATVKLNGSMGFHASALDRISMTILRIEDATRTSYSVMLRSEPVDASSEASAGLNLTDVIESAPHENSCVGSDLWVSTYNT